MSKLALLLLAALFALGVVVGASAQGVMPTPTPTPASSWPSLIETPTPYEPYSGGNYSCPTGVPQGWGTVTPGVDWVLSCWACLATPTLTPTVTVTSTVGPGTPVPPTLTPTATSLPTATPSPVPGDVQFSDADPNTCSGGVYYYESGNQKYGADAKWPGYEQHIYGCGPYPRQGVLHYQYSITLNNPYNGNMCFSFAIDDVGSVSLGCFHNGTQTYEGDFVIPPGGYWWPGKRVHLDGNGSAIDCISCYSLSYTDHVIFSLRSNAPAPTPTPIPTEPSYCSRVDPGQDLSAYFDFAGLTIVSETCYNIPADLPVSINVPPFVLCLDQVLVGDVRIMGYVIHLHYILLGLVAVLLYRFLVKF